MRHYLIAAATLATLAGAMPASADVARTPVIAAVAHARAVGGASRACAVTLGSTACAGYQARILVDAANRAGPTPDPIAMRELGRRQLDALIASVQ